MPTGSCLCGSIKLEWSGEPVMSALCHCSDCRKISGGLYSSNIAIPKEHFKILSGAPKLYTVTAASGKTMTNNFCADCGTTLFRYGDSFGGADGLQIIKTGVTDDIEVLNNTKPQSELFAEQRVKWVPQLHGTTDVTGMP